MKDQKSIEMTLQSAKDEKTNTEYEFIKIYLQGVIDGLSSVLRD